MLLRTACALTTVSGAGNYREGSLGLIVYVAWVTPSLVPVQHVTCVCFSDVTKVAGEQPGGVVRFDSVYVAWVTPSLAPIPYACA